MSVAGDVAAGGGVREQVSAWAVNNNDSVTVYPEPREWTARRGP